MIRKLSTKRQKQYREYLKLRRGHLKNNPECYCCGFQATEIHHRKGRVGELLTDTTTFISLCRSCHHWIESHPLEAKEKGYSLSRLAV